MSFEELVANLKSTTTRWEKEYYLGKYDCDYVRYLLSETFDPALLHNVKLQQRSLPAPGAGSLEDFEDFIRNMFDYLSSSQSSKVNRGVVHAIMAQLAEEDQKLLLAVVNKKLKAGVSIKTLNKVWPGFIDVQPIQLANKYSLKKKYNVSTWMESDKLDGVRIFAFRIGSKWHIYSRAKDYIGRELFTLDHWKEDLEQYYLDSGFTYLEGEAYKHGWEFSVIQGLVFSTVNLKELAQELEFHCFLNGRCNEEIRCGDNLSHMDIAVSSMFWNYPSLVGIKYRAVRNVLGDIKENLVEAVERGYEGTMLRDMNKVHSPKRDDHLLKVKPQYFKESADKWDCTIIDVEFDDFTIQEDGVITTELLPVRLIVEQPDDIVCKVGSGFKLPWRRELKKDPGIIIGKTGEFEYYGIGSHGRMRFPIFKRIREDI